MDDRNVLWQLLTGKDLPDLSQLLGAPAWHQRAACKGETDGMFPERGADLRPAKVLCASCTVRSECLDYALDESITFGIWGGTSERQRKTLRRTRRSQDGTAA